MSDETTTRAEDSTLVLRLTPFGQAWLRASASDDPEELPALFRRVRDEKLASKVKE